PDDEYPGWWRRPRARGHDHPGDRGLQSRGRSHEISGADPRRFASLDTEEVLLLGRPRRDRRARGGRWAWCGAGRSALSACTGGLPGIPGVQQGGRGGGGQGGAAYALQDSSIPGQTDKDETSLFDGLDISLAGIAQYAGPNPPAPLKAGLAAIVDQAIRTQKA